MCRVHHYVFRNVNRGRGGSDGWCGWFRKDDPWSYKAHTVATEHHRGSPRCRFCHRWYQHNISRLETPLGEDGAVHEDRGWNLRGIINNRCISPSSHRHPLLASRFILMRRWHGPSYLLHTGYVLHIMGGIDIPNILVEDHPCSEQPQQQHQPISWPYEWHVWICTRGWASEENWITQADYHTFNAADHGYINSSWHHQQGGSLTVLWNLPYPLWHEKITPGGICIW